MAGWRPSLPVGAPARNFVASRAWLRGEDGGCGMDGRGARPLAGVALFVMCAAVGLFGQLKVYSAMMGLGS